MNRYLDTLHEKNVEEEGCLEGCVNGCFNGCGCLIIGSGLFIFGVYGVYTIIEYFLN